MFKEWMLQTINVDRSSLRAPWQNVPYKNKHLQQHETPMRLRYVKRIQHSIFVQVNYNNVKTKSLRILMRFACLPLAKAHPYPWVHRSINSFAEKYYLFIIYTDMFVEYMLILTRLQFICKSMSAHKQHTCMVN